MPGVSYAVGVVSCSVKPYAGSVAGPASSERQQRINNSGQQARKGDTTMGVYEWLRYHNTVDYIRAVENPEPCPEDDGESYNPESE